MTKHYVLNLDPSAQYEWDRCTLRDPITAERPELAQLVAEAVGGQAGSYLIAVDIQVKVLEKVAHPPRAKSNTLNPVETAPTRSEELVA
jgi:hypothetical protein